MGDFITLEEAARRSGLHLNSLKRLLRQGVLRGFKTVHGGRRRWLVSMASLRQYTDPMTGWLLDMPGPKLFLKRAEEDPDKE
jgi:excisionase family DNA binding protein